MRGYTRFNVRSSRGFHLQIAKHDPKLARACLGKMRYPSRRAAEGVARVTPAREGFELLAYKCKNCRRWHVGNSRLSGRRREPSPTPQAWPSPVRRAAASTDKADAMTVHELANRLRSATLPVGLEAAFHAAVGQVLAEADVDARDEHRLDAGSVIDFYVPALKLGIELKVNGSPTAVARQLYRYAEHPDIETLMLVTGRPRLGQLPPTLAGKPLIVVLAICGAF